MRRRNEGMMSTEYSYNERYLMKDGRPWFPVMGEMHYSRYRADLWEESLRKMKAGGVTIVSTYLIWIHHEEEEGVFDFSGCRNLRGFLECCRKVGIKVCLRLGPWVHGEVRNGGFPDWVVALGEKGVDLRSNDETYLSYVRRFWTKVYEQTEGFLHKDGGPVIGVQLENEYGHVGGYRGEKGEAHMRRLTALARELGFDVPLYTATGWGGACIGDCLPVMGGYCDAPWDQRVTELPANTNYIISHVRNDSLIACDHHVEDAVTFDESRFPYLTAELGGGLQVTGHRRPVATGSDIGAMSTTKLASGVALLGYYMYHGGSNPKGKLSTLQESRATGYANDLPEINYDFNAPVRQYGSISDNYREIKLLALFLKDFGEDMAALPAEIWNESIKPEDMHSLRSSCRHDGSHGYVFFNNYQRRRTMEPHENVVFEAPCKAGKLQFPPVTLESGAYGFFPYHMQLGGAHLISALATPLCRLKGANGEETYVFYGDYEPQYRWEGSIAADLIHLTRKQALDAWKVSLERDYLILSENYVWEQDGRLVVTGAADTRIMTYPALDKEPDGFVRMGTEGELTVYERRCVTEAAGATFRKTEEDAESITYEIVITYPNRPDKAERLSGRDSFLWITYAGYGLEVFLDGEKVNDHFYTGQRLPISLGYFHFPERLTVKVRALHEGEHVFIEQWPEMTEGRACAILKTEICEEFR